MTDFNSVEAVENGDSYIFIKKDMGDYTWYMTGFWTWYNLPDTGIFFIKAYPKKLYPKKRKKGKEKVERKPLPKPEALSFDADPQPISPPPLQAWNDQYNFDTKEEFWDFVDTMTLNCKEYVIQSRIYLEARKVLNPGQR